MVQTPRSLPLSSEAPSAIEAPPDSQRQVFTIELGCSSCASLGAEAKPAAAAARSPSRSAIASVTDSPVDHMAMTTASPLRFTMLRFFAYGFVRLFFKSKCTSTSEASAAPRWPGTRQRPPCCKLGVVGRTAAARSKSVACAATSP